MPYESIMSSILGMNWAITPEALNGLVSIVNKYSDYSEEDLKKVFHAKLTNENYEAFLPSDGTYLEGTKNATLHGSVAVIPVIGPIFPRANLMSKYSGAVSLDSLGNDLRIALENDSVTSILLNIDSPGGAVTGVSDLSDFIHNNNATNSKKINAFIAGYGASAAYWFPSAAEKIYISKTGQVGSIGVVAGYTDTSAKDEKSGVKKIEIVSSVSPYKRPDPTTETGKSQIQAMVDNIANIFVLAVAENRRVDVKTVLENFGAGGMILGEKAVELGMADEVITINELIKNLNAETGSAIENNNNIFNSNDGSIVMDYAKIKSEHPEIFNQIKSEGFAEGVAAESTRIKSLESMSTPGSEKLIAEHKFDSAIDKGQMAIMIFEHEKKVKENAKEKNDADGAEAAVASEKINDSTDDAELDSQAEESMINNMREGAK